MARRCPAGTDLDPLHECSRDRKSTRLNSSHSQISYAVFCLKKKKKKLFYSCHKALYIILIYILIAYTTIVSSRTLLINTMSMYVLSPHICILHRLTICCVLL